MAYGRENLRSHEEEVARIEIELKNAADAVLKGGDSETLTKIIQEREKRRRYLDFQVRQIKTANQEKVYVTPSAMREKFKNLVNTMQKKPKDAASALKKIFPENLKMKWDGEKWEVSGTMAVGSGGMRKEIKLQF